MTSDRPPALSGRISDLLLAWAAIGRGVKLPESFSRAPGAVYTTALCDSTQAAFLQAEAIFSDEQAEARRPLRERLEIVEASLADMKGKREIRDVALSMMGDIGAATKEGLSKEAKQLREQLAMLPCVTWDDPDAGRATMLEIMTKAAFGAVAVADFHGGRITKAITASSRMITEAQTVALTAPDSNATAVIRASATGGANIHSTAGTAKPVFTYISRVDRGLAQRIAKRIAGSSSGFNGGALIIHTESDRYRQPRISRETYLKLLRQVFVRGSAEAATRPMLRYESSELEARWNEFARWGWEQTMGGPQSEAGAALEERMEASFRTIMSFAAMAAFAAAVIRNLPVSGPPPTDVVINESDLEEAKQFAQFLVTQSHALASHTARISNAEKAREARKPSEHQMVKMARFLREVIEQSETGAVSRKRALQIPGMTASTLDTLAAGVEFIELTGKQPRMKNVKHAYALRAGLTLSASEAEAELAAAMAEFESDSCARDPIEADRVHDELAEKAAENNQKHMLPCVPLTQMTARQIQHLPRVLLRLSDVCLRGTEDHPEPDHLLDDPDDPQGECFLVRGVANLWFRCDSRGYSFRPGGWSKTNLGFSHRWGCYDAGGAS